MLLQAGRQPQHLRFPVPAERDYPHNLGTGTGEGACLIKHNGIRPVDGFQKLPALHGDMLPAGFAHGRQYGKRHGKL